MAALVLEVTNLSVRLPSGADRLHAIENATFAVGAGEIVCVVGESGSGKSVTSFAVMGLLPQTLRQNVSGSIKLCGEELVGAAPDRLRALRGARMSMIFQEPMTALNPMARVGDQIAEVMTIHGRRAGSRKRVLELMESMRLPDPAKHARAYPHQLSGGQRQRVMIAMALALGPALLIADEPTTALDVTTQAQILKLIKDLRQNHQAGVLFITHDIGVVADIADRVVVMQSGRVVEQGPASQVLYSPAHPYTAALIAAIPSFTPPERPPAPQREKIVCAENIAKSYGGGWFGKGRRVEALKASNLTLARGETLGVVGESGSGKSTLARVIARLIEPSTGAIHINDTDIAGLTGAHLQPFRKQIQIVFQDPSRSLNPRLRVGDSLTEGPLNFGMARSTALAKAREVAPLVGLSAQSLDRYPHEFSGGQRQRLCIARALMMEPQLLVADEAVSALDMSVQKQVLELLDDVRRKFNLAILFITHDLRVAAQICDRIAVMRQGEIVEMGETKTIFSHPAHQYTRELMEAVPGRKSHLVTRVGV
ncbi:ABC transporter ATP-binding protein [Terrarubrum flagellatum]|uniref:ABC transporter ATP-binding protein n=1 Tax=Terrirubrum flagellatum TaxID=2895980 RepID=UPI0031454018